MNKYAKAYKETLKRRPRRGENPIKTFDSRETHMVSGNVEPIERKAKLSSSDLYQKDGWNISKENRDNERRRKAMKALSNAIYWDRD